jgi:hypothetical protein
MTTPDVAALTGRVERLEKQNSLLKRLGMVALICAGSLVVMAQNRTRSIDAESFVLKDAGGKTRARLAMIGSTRTIVPG